MEFQKSLHFAKKQVFDQKFRNFDFCLKVLSICAKFSVGNPRDLLTRNTDFIAILAPLKVRLFKISPVIRNGIYSNKVH